MVSVSLTSQTDFHFYYLMLRTKESEAILEAINYLLHHTSRHIKNSVSFSPLQMRVNLFLLSFFSPCMCRLLRVPEIRSPSQIVGTDQQVIFFLSIEPIISGLGMMMEESTSALQAITRLPTVTVFQSLIECTSHGLVDNGLQSRILQPYQCMTRRTIYLLR